MLVVSEKKNMTELRLTKSGNILPMKQVQVQVRVWQ